MTPTEPDRATASEHLVDGVLGLPRRLPEQISNAARLHLLDAIGVGQVAARAGPTRGIVDAPRPPGSCTVLGTAAGSAPADAALANGTLIHSLEYDDTHTGSVMHGSSVLVPSVLAAAEDRNADGHDVLRAFAAGWEALVRLGSAVPGGFQRVGFQGTSIAGPIAGALAVGLLSGLDRAQLLDAVGLAASFSSGNFTFLGQGATSKAAQAGIAAQAAISAVHLARAGVTGPRDIFEGERGFFGLYARDPSGADRLRSLTDDLGSTWHLANAAFKGLPCCHFLHPFVEAVAMLGIAPGESHRLRRIICRVPKGQEQVIALPWARKQAPRRADEARWSLPYVVALRAVHGQVTLDDFTGTPDPEVLRTAARVEWEPWPDSGYPTVFPAEIKVEWADGTTQAVHIEDVDGNAGRPWDSARVLDKFRNNCHRAGASPGSTQQLIDGVITAGSPDLSVLRSAGALNPG